MNSRLKRLWFGSAFSDALIQSGSERRTFTLNVGGYYRITNYSEFVEVCLTAKEQLNANNLGNLADINKMLEKSNFVANEVEFCCK